mgnify:CR=1 FL=1
MSKSKKITVIIALTIAIISLYFCLCNLNFSANVLAEEDLDAKSASMIF